MRRHLMTAHSLINRIMFLPKIEYDNVIKIRCSRLTEQPKTVRDHEATEIKDCQQGGQCQMECADERKNHCRVTVAESGWTTEPPV